jgi:hypothetical protein
VWAKDVWQDGLIIELSGAAKQAFGDRLTMEQFADLVMQFWRGSGGCPKQSNIGGSSM